MISETAESLIKILKSLFFISFYGQRAYKFTRKYIFTSLSLQCIRICTYLTNMRIPVGSMALLIPFQDAIMVYFCLAVRGRRGSGGAGAVGSGRCPSPPSLSDLDLWFPLWTKPNFPSSHPMVSTHFLKQCFETMHRGKKKEALTAISSTN